MHHPQGISLHLTIFGYAYVMTSNPADLPRKVTQLTNDVNSIYDILRRIETPFGWPEGACGHSGRAQWEAGRDPGADAGQLTLPGTGPAPPLLSVVAAPGPSRLARWLVGPRVLRAAG